MILVIAIGPQTILLIVAGMTGHAFVGVDLLDMVRGIFVQAGWRLHTLTGTVGRWLSGWLSGRHDGRKGKRNSKGIKKKTLSSSR